MSNLQQKMCVLRRGLKLLVLILSFSLPLLSCLAQDQRETLSHSLSDLLSAHEHQLNLSADFHFASPSVPLSLVPDALPIPLPVLL